MVDASFFFWASRSFDPSLKEVMAWGLFCTNYIRYKSRMISLLLDVVQPISPNPLSSSLTPVHHLSQVLVRVHHHHDHYQRWITVTRSRTVALMSPQILAGISEEAWLLPTLELLSSPDCCSSLFKSDRNRNLPVAGTLST